MNLRITPNFSTLSNSQLQQTRTNNSQPQSSKHNMTFGMTGEIDFKKIYSLATQFDVDKTRILEILERYSLYEQKYLTELGLFHNAKKIVEGMLKNKTKGLDPNAVKEAIREAGNDGVINIKLLIPEWNEKHMQIRFLEPDAASKNPLLIPTISLDGITNKANKGFSLMNDDPERASTHIPAAVDGWIEQACEGQINEVVAKVPQNIDAKIQALLKMRG